MERDQFGHGKKVGGEHRLGHDGLDRAELLGVEVGRRPAGLRHEVAERQPLPVRDEQQRAGLGTAEVRRKPVAERPLGPVGQGVNRNADDVLGMSHRPARP